MIDELITKYTKILDTLKENRVNESDTMHDPEVFLLDEYIKQMASVVRDLKALKEKK